MSLEKSVDPACSTELVTLGLLKAPVTPTTDPQDGGFDTFLNYVCTRNPTASEPALPYSNYPWLPFWWQTANSSDSWTTYTTSDFWLCVNNTMDSMVWWRMVFDANILSVLNGQGWGINTSRSYSQRVSPAFNTAYTPSATNDTTVIITLGLVDTLLTPCSVNMQVNTGAGYVTIATAGLSGVAATETTPVTIVVPAGASYKIISVSGSPTINSIFELTQ
jgi:hypothetical protein